MRFTASSAKAAILRRPVVDGALRGDFAPAWTTWCSWRPLSGQPLVEAGLAQDETGLMLRVNDSARNRTLTNADRLRFGGADYAIVTVAPRDRAGGFIEMTLRRHIGG